MKRMARILGLLVMSFILAGVFPVLAAETSVSSSSHFEAKSGQGGIESSFSKSGGGNVPDPEAQARAEESRRISEQRIETAKQTLEAAKKRHAELVEKSKTDSADRQKAAAGRALEQSERAKEQIKQAQLLLEKLKQDQLLVSQRAAVESAGKNKETAERVKEAQSRAEAQIVEARKSADQAGANADERKAEAGFGRGFKKS